MVGRFSRLPAPISRTCCWRAPPRDGVRWRCGSAWAPRVARVRQLLAESLLLAALGGAAGILFAIWGVRFLTLLLAGGSDFTLHAELNWHVLAAAAALTTITGLLFGLAPALQATRVDIMPVLREMGDRRTRGPLRFGLTRILVVAQIAISLLLLVGAGLFVRTLSALQSLEVGFQRENLLTFTLNARQAGHRDPRSCPSIRTFRSAWRPFLACAARPSRIRRFSVTRHGAGRYFRGKQRPDKAPSGQGSGMAAMATHVLATAPGFFATMQIPLLAGRDFDGRDRLGSPPVAIDKQAWAKANLEGVNPLGQRIVNFSLRGLKPQDMEIVGVAKNARYDLLTGDFPAIVYMPFAQDLVVPVEEMTFFLRTAGDPLAFAGTIRKIVQQADARIPVTNPARKLRRSKARCASKSCSHGCVRYLPCWLWRLRAWACTARCPSVARRTGEIGIRMALGAQRGTMVWMVLRDVLILTLVGLAISLPAALGGSKLLESLLFGVKPGDPVAMAAAVAILLSAALVAGYLPARKASRIDPMTAVRRE